MHRAVIFILSVSYYGFSVDEIFSGSIWTSLLLKMSKKSKLESCSRKNP